MSLMTHELTIVFMMTRTLDLNWVDSVGIKVEPFRNQDMEHTSGAITWWGYQLTKTVQNGGPQAIFEILHIEYRIVCCIETYFIYIYHMSKCCKCN